MRVSNKFLGMLFNFGVANVFKFDLGKPEKEERNCIECKKPKTHNNSFCSAECCKIYNKRDKAVRKFLEASKKSDKDGLFKYDGMV